jgi:hypothetical protein
MRLNSTEVSKGQLRLGGESPNAMGGGGGDDHLSPRITILQSRDVLLRKAPSLGESMTRGRAGRRENKRRNNALPGDLTRASFP